MDVKVWTNNTYHLLCTLKRDCAFYKQCLKLNTHNNLRKLIHDVNCRAVEEYLDRQLAGRKLSEEAREFFVSFLSSAFTETNINYILEDARVTPEKMLQYYYNFTEPALLTVLQKFIESDSGEGMKPVE